jgi:superfamily II DNA or RNA helicase
MALWSKIANIAGEIKEVTCSNVSKNKNIYTDCKNKDIVLTRQGVKVDMYFLQDIGIHNKIIKKFTISIPTLMGYNITVNNHKQDSDKGRYIFPRFGFIDYIEKNFKNYNFKNKIGLGKSPSTIFKWNGSFTNNQPIIADYIMKNYFNIENANAGKSGVILNLEAGQGKTYLATGLIEKLQKKTLVITHNKSILHQWIKILKTTYPENKIASFYGEKKEFNGDITVGVINSLLMQPKEFFYKFGYVIFDEVHEYVSKTRKKIYQLCSSTYMLGLSATPLERADGLDVVNLFNCGSILNASEIEGYSMENIDFKGEVKCIKYHGHPDYTELIMNEKLEIVSFSKMVSQMCTDPYRIHLIVKTIYELRQKNMQVLVFADRRSYLEEIRIELERFHIQTDILDDVDIKAKRLVGGAKADTIENAKKYSNVILSTFQFFGTGVSIPKLDAVVLCSPRKRKSKQFIGRIFRLGSDYNIVRQIIDIVDWGSVLKNSWQLRKKYYKNMEYPIEEIKVNYKDLESEMLEMGILTEHDENGNEINVIDKNLTELEKLLEKKKVLDLDLDDLELLNEYSD